MVGNPPFHTFIYRIFFYIFLREKAVSNVSELLSYRTSGLFHPLIRLRNFILEDYLIFSIRPTRTYIITYILNFILPSGGNFKTFIIHLTHVHCRQLHCQITRIQLTSKQYVLTMFNEIVKRGFQMAIKEMHIDTIVLFGSCFPSYIRITDFRLDSPG